MEKNTAALSPAEEALRDAALEYHRSPVRDRKSTRLNSSHVD